MDPWVYIYIYRETIGLQAGIYASFEIIRGFDKWYLEGAIGGDMICRDFYGSRLSKNPENLKSWGISVKVFLGGFYRSQGFGDFHDSGMFRASAKKIRGPFLGCTTSRVIKDWAIQWSPKLSQQSAASWTASQFLVVQGYAFLELVVYGYVLSKGSQ